MLSGAVLDPSTLKDLVPDFKAKGAPLAAEVQRDDIYFLTRTAKLRLPITPPFFRNHGNYIISLNKFVKWLAGLVEAEGIDIFTGFAATEVLFDGDAVAGVRTGDRGIDKHGQKKSTFEPGVDIRARVTIFTDGVRGNLDQGARAPARAGRWEEPGGVCDWPQGVVGSAGGPRRARSRRPHDGLPAEDGGVRRRVHVLDAGEPRVARAGGGSRLQGSDVRSARRLPAPEAASARRVGARGGNARPLRRQGVARRRLVHDSEDLRGRRADRRGCRRVHELGAAQGHPSRHAHRHARRGHGVRGGPQRGHVRGGDEALRRSRAGERRAQGTLPGA